MTEARSFNTSPLPVKLRVEDYLLLDDAGAFAEYGRTELLEGEIVYMSPQHRPHARIKSRLFLLMAESLAGRTDRLEALVEGSVSMPPHNVPEPDISITSEPEGEGLIPLSSLALVVEVADSSLRHDLSRKLRIYAREGVPEYWVVDLNSAIIHQMWSPTADSYREQRIVRFGERLEAMTVAGLVVDTSVL